MNDNRKTEAEVNEHSVSSDSPRRPTPRIYVACLAAYTAGRLYGRWIDATQTAEAIQAEIAAMLDQSVEPIAEDWAIHDYEGFGEAGLSEFEPIERVAEFARLIDVHGPVFAALVSRCGNMQAAVDLMENGHCGAYASHAQYVEESIEDCFGDALKHLPDFVRHRIDYAVIADDFESSGAQFTIECDGMVHVFDNR